MLSYFNLNERSENANQNRAKNIRAAAPEPAAVSLSVFQQIFMYFGVVIGVIFSSTVTCITRPDGHIQPASGPDWNLVYRCLW